MLRELVHMARRFVVPWAFGARRRPAESPLRMASKIAAALLPIALLGSPGVANAEPFVNVGHVVVDEGDGYAEFLIKLSAPSALATSIYYSTASGSALTSDYDSTSGTLTFAPGETLKAVRIPVANDGSIEGDESFYLRLSNPGGLVIGTSYALATIADNDGATGVPAIRVSDPIVDESAGEAVFVILLDRTSAVAVSVDYATQPESASVADFTPRSGTALFAPRERAVMVRVPIIDDRFTEQAEEFHLQLFRAVQASIVDTRGTATIGSSDQPPAVTPGVRTSDVVVGEGDGFAQFVIRLGAPSVLVTSVYYSTVSGSALTSDYDSTSGTLTFAPGETLKAVRIPVANDGSIEGDESFYLRLSNPGGVTIVVNQGQATIIDNDGPSQPLDRDRDTVADSSDNCPIIPNQDQSDIDSDGMGDACDPNSRPPQLVDPAAPVSVITLPPLNPAARATERHLVLLAHGWRSNPDAWAISLGTEIRRHLDSPRPVGSEPDASRWDVRVVDWSELADVLLPPIAYTYAGDAADSVWNQLLLDQVSGEYKYVYVHLIGHSAGSNLIESLARRFKAVGATVHQTFFDPYSPYLNFSRYGQRADWAENYVDTRRIVGEESLPFGIRLLLNSADLTLSGAINVNVTAIDPDPPLLAPIDQFYRGHTWPYIWYRDYTMLSVAQWSYGFRLSREYGLAPGGAQSPVPTKNPRTGIPSHGSRELRRGTRLCFEAPPGPAVDCPISATLAPPEETVAGAVVNEEYEQADIVDVKANAVPNPWLASSTPPVMSAGANWNSGTGRATLSTGTTAWIKFSGDVTEPFNTLWFEYQFTSGPTADGVLTVYVDDIPVYSRRQRFAGGGLNLSDLVPIGEFASGTHFLALRLDALTSEPVSATISAIRTGASYIERTVNIEPTAAIVPLPGNVTAGTRIVLDGRPSRDDDGLPSPLSYFWTQTAGPDVAIESPQSSVTNVTPTTAGTYSFQLIVRDGQADSAPATVTFDVEPAAGGPLASFTLKKSLVAGCKTVSGTVTLSAPAPATGTVVNVSDTLAAATAPATVKVAAGATSKNFTIKSSAVAANQSGTVTVAIGAQSLSQALTLRPMGMLSLTSATASVVGGANIDLTAKLECKAGPGPITVNVSSTNPALANPVAPSIVIPLGVQTAPVAVRTQAVGVTTKPKISASAGGIVKSKTLTVTPPP